MKEIVAFIVMFTYIFFIPDINSGAIPLFIIFLFKEVQIQLVEIRINLGGSALLPFNTKVEHAALSRWGQQKKEVSMKKTILLLKGRWRTALLVLLLSAAGMGKGYAFDFRSVCSTGQTLYYDIIDATNHYVELACPNPTAPGWDGFSKPEGDLVIPDAVIFNGITYSVTNVGYYAFRKCSGLTSVTFPNTLISISGYGAFHECTGLTSLSFPNSLTTIGNSAFEFCSGLTSVSLPNSLITIDDGAFNQCDLTSVVIPNSVTSIGNCAFYRLYNLTSITIGSSVSLIESNAFSYCTKLASITVFCNTPPSSDGNPFNYVNKQNVSVMVPCGTLSEYQVASIWSDFTNFQEDCPIIFADYRVKTLCVGNWDTDGDEELCYSEAAKVSDLSSVFSEESSITSFDELQYFTGLTSINSSAFERCGNLTSVTLPNSVNYIGSYAFERCYRLTLTILSNTPPSIGNDIFENITNSIIVYVPYESINTYKTDANWSSYVSRIQPWLPTSVTGYGESTESDKWAFIASPLSENTAPTATAIEGLMAETATEYDLYRFNQDAAAEWENYKNAAHTEGFVLENGQGYLYASKEDADIIFKGTFNEGTSKEVNLTYTEGKRLAGWNLVGNPFPYAATVDRSYYVMNAGGTGIEPTPLSAGTSIEACTGIMVKADDEGESVTFAKPSRVATENKGMVKIAVAASTGTVADRAIVSFNEEDVLEKFYFGEQAANIYIPQGGREYAIVSVGGTDVARNVSTCVNEMPINFKATKNGTYTLSVNPEGVEIDYLHLIDNMTGADVDLLPLCNPPSKGAGGLGRGDSTNPTYTFTAKTTDYESRFRLVFSICGDANGDNAEAPFAFISNGNIVITADTQNATLQIVDAMGRVVVCTDVARNVSTNGLTVGVYVLRLIDGNDVKTQKIVIQ